MKPKPFLYCIVISTFLLHTAVAQTIEEQMTKKQPDCGDVYANALKVLPKLYREKAYDSMYVALEIWKEACGNSPEVRITGILLGMQENRFKIDEADSSLIDLLEYYARAYVDVKNPRYYYYRNELQKSFFQFSSVWARLMPEVKRLDNNEAFICKVLTGEIVDPVYQLKQNREKYPDLASLVKKKETWLRSGVRSDFSIVSGIWIPTGNLRIVGNHASLGFQAGGRDKHNQLDFTMQFRFLKSANTYQLKRNNVYYDSDEFFGGYIGIDYTYYLMSAQRTDLGLLAGMGYDGFDVFKSNTDRSLSPNSIGSFNANGGVRFNYFVSPTLYLGVLGRFNWINYNNRGGTNMSGNAFSIDFVFGGNGKRG